MPRKTTTRERLIGTAAELFWKQGYAQTGVNEIIQQAQATSGSFYHFFPTKEDLWVAAVETALARFMERLLPDLEALEGLDPATRLKLVFQFFWEPIRKSYYN